MSANGKAKRRKCEVEKLDWTTAYSYKRTSAPHNVELTLPLESMQEICRKYWLVPEHGATEASYQAFHDWLVRHRRTRKLFYGHQTGFDIRSLVNLFDDDLKGTAKIWNNAEKQKKGQSND